MSVLLFRYLFTMLFLFSPFLSSQAQLPVKGGATILTTVLRVLPGQQGVDARKILVAIKLAAIFHHNSQSWYVQNTLAMVMAAIF